MFHNQLYILNLAQQTDGTDLQLCPGHGGSEHMGRIKAVTLVACAIPWATESARWRAWQQQEGGAEAAAAAIRRGGRLAENHAMVGVWVAAPLEPGQGRKEKLRDGGRKKNKQNTG